MQMTNSLHGNTWRPPKTFEKKQIENTSLLCPSFFIALLQKKKNRFFFFNECQKVLYCSAIRESEEFIFPPIISHRNGI